MESGSIRAEGLLSKAPLTQAVAQHRFDLLEGDGERIALIETVAHPGHLRIKNLAVSPRHQGTGLGRRMLAHAGHLARSLGQAEIRLVTNKAVASNVTFCQRAGFVIDRQEAFEAGVAVYFRKAL